ncbi:MAG: DUF3717 domain-containing protein [Burkholderiaceae bacterium]|nr:DUF3717 domain-containing protein [Burkholderiaceae bacterium]MCD8515827.1 DUF3717 domain-containing protein [Burkholderiaceae bacterium]MCD8536173.1 DUF3717 domain-containing protein [Burkholderiaceae bacterium]MCD8565037.1 DUF3717 domain-containing protein [Burkholderiaceae bacterium]
MTSEISITELEAAINYWRQINPSEGEEMRLTKTAAALAEPYAMMIMTHRQSLSVDWLGEDARVAIDQWRTAMGR